MIKKVAIATEAGELSDMPDPTEWRIPRGGTTGSASARGDGEAQSGSGGSGVVDTTQMFERVDISDQITPQLLVKLKDRDWQKRLDGLNEIDKILLSANKYISSKRE